jgi:hypothetical protein
MEILVTVSIIAVLMAIMLPVLGAVRRRAKKARAEREIAELTEAWLSYRLEYKRFPETDFDRMNEDGVSILRGSPDHADNPRNVCFIDFRSGTTHYCDPWGDQSVPKGEYRVVFDKDLKNEVEVNGQDLPVSVAIWSAGPDGVDFTSDDIVNWER